MQTHRKQAAVFLVCEAAAVAIALGTAPAVAQRGKLALDQWERRVVDAEKPWRAVFIDSADMDGDGKMDIVTGGWWYKNPGTTTDTWTRSDIGKPLYNMAAVYDFDGDGDPDVLGTTGKGLRASAKFVWAQNRGKGRFRIRENIERGNGDYLMGCGVAHFQKGGPLQVALSWHKTGRGVQMLTLPAKPTRGTWQCAAISMVSERGQLGVGDIDRDGDQDLLLGTKWLRNSSGGGWAAYRVSDTRAKPDRNRLVDINDDDRLDAVVAYETTGKPGRVAWYEQSDRASETWREHLIGSVVGPMSLDVGDLDRDGDPDVVVGEHNPDDVRAAQLHIFENADGTGGRWVRHTIAKGDEHRNGARLTDIDGDGDLDIISIGWGHPRVLLYENKAIGR